MKLKLAGNALVTALFTVMIVISVVLFTSKMLECHQQFQIKQQQAVVAKIMVKITRDKLANCSENKIFKFTTGSVEVESNHYLIKLHDGQIIEMKK